ncbi:hypothetical protein AGR1A_pAt20542 [Agrobacterium fabacearum CFBP 5771]|nr:hypothetical protein AGR1A_pAt20542 [Agrobacterium fabacearum CFBP 5771]
MLLGPLFFSMSVTTLWNSYWAGHYSRGEADGEFPVVEQPIFSLLVPGMAYCGGGRRPNLIDCPTELRGWIGKTARAKGRAVPSRPCEADLREVMF